MELLFIHNLENIVNEVQTGIGICHFEKFNFESLDEEIEFINFIKSAQIKYEQDAEFDLTFKGVSKKFKIVYLESAGGNPSNLEMLNSN